MSPSPPAGQHFDVVVIGGGAAGCPAAVQAARLGARTLLVEKSAALGGTTTVAGVFTTGLFHAWGEQVIAGIGWELATRAMEVAGTPLPDVSDWRQPHWKHSIRVTPVIMSAVLDQAMAEAGVDLRLHTMLAAVERGAAEGDPWRITLCGREGLSSVTAAVLVDASGDANVVGQLGLPRRTVEELQPGTLMVRLGGYDLDSLDREAIESAGAAAMVNGELRAEDFSSPNGDPVWRFLVNRGQNAMHVTGIRAGTSIERTAADVAARATFLRIFSFLRSQPGLEDLVVEGWSTECGIRETWTVVGEATITADDYTSGRVWPDAVCHSFFPIDLHTAVAEDIHFRPLEYGVVPTIPLGALVPRGEDRLLVAGRILSSDRLANSAARVQASCMAMGQAVGAAAATAVRTGSSVRGLDPVDLRTVLRAHGAIVPEPTHIEAAAHSPQDRRG